MTALARLTTSAREWRALQRTRWHVARDLTPPHPSAFAAFGTGSFIVPPARVLSPHCIEVGSGVVVLEHAWFSVQEAHAGRVPRLVIGDGVRLGRALSIACIGEVTIGDGVMTSDDVFVADCYHDYRDPTTPVLFQPMSEPEPVVIEAGAYLAAQSIVLPGVRVGEGAFVGEGAVVTRDVAPHTVVYGNPARVVRRYDDAAATWIGRNFG
jgi:acetyltransferase-like isoleucine patch superfamily enzyme